MIKVSGMRGQASIVYTHFYNYLPFSTFFFALMGNLVFGGSLTFVNPPAMCLISSGYHETMQQTE